jgi:hypothetical protein
LGDLEGRSLKIGKHKYIIKIFVQKCENYHHGQLRIKHRSHSNPRRPLTLSTRKCRALRLGDPPAESATTSCPSTSCSCNGRPEPQISLPEKFDGTRLKFQSFVSKVRLIMQLHPCRYFDDTTHVGFVGILLIGIAAAWFAPILETSSPLLQDFNAFKAEFEVVFGDSGKARTSTNKLLRLQQGTRSAIVYAS